MIIEQFPTRIVRIKKKIDIAHLIRDPDNQPQIWEYPINQQDEVKRTYINLGSYQPLIFKYSLTGKKHHHRFQFHWFKSFSWLEYSKKNVTFCFTYYLFASKPTRKSGSDIFTIKRFNCWEKVNGEKQCAFLTHLKKYPNSAYRFAIECLKNLKNQSCHFERVVGRQTS